jgi:UDP-glucose 6-dehydrogenase
MEENKQTTGAVQGAAPATIEEALPVIAELQKTNGDLATSLNDAKTVIAELKEQLESAKTDAAAQSTVPVVTIDGVKYQVNHGALGIGSPADIVANPDLGKKILAIEGQQALTKI